MKKQFSCKIIFFHVFSKFFMYPLKNYFFHNFVMGCHTGKSGCGSRMIRHILRCQAQATLIFPFWSSTHWWPILKPLLSQFPTVSLGPSSQVLTYPPGSPIPTSQLPQAHLFAIHFPGPTQLIPLP